ncbi:hypothetical protein ACMDCR_21035 [Labrys okinawensis]|uniref:hypothetical protein n=1 Tax=Labrys okinawensis TaxID=346911 RepID=UPI0039BC83BC
MESRQQIGLAAIGVIGLALALGGFALKRPAVPSRAVEADMAAAAPASPPAPPAAAVPTPRDAESCLRKGIVVTLSQASFHISGPPALTVITGDGVDDEINFATKAGVDKACQAPAITAKAIALNFDAMEKDWGVAANWRTEFCTDAAPEAIRFLCGGEERPKGTPRRLALVAIYNPDTFNGESMFPQEAPQYANFLAWKDRLTKAGTPPPAQADGDFDVYPGGVWVERDGKGGDPFLVACDADVLPVTGQHYCIGTLALDKGLRARVEFRTVTGQIGTEAGAAQAHLRTLLAAWK